ncbi:TRP-domain-containing protein [Phlegmacium glaucopus]|nr:TRP-domain-containing protein [Phlegmacium glaucopus]
MFTFSILAWSRALVFALLLSALMPASYAREESLFASSVTYCNPPETLLVQRFEIAYFPHNTSVVFNLSISSVQANVNVSANLFLNVYGMNPVNVTLDLCNLLNGALCPLPMYNFTGADTLTLPPSLSVLDKLPAIAFKIPDLEGFGQLTLTEVNTGVVKACVQATISNGWSAHQPAVEWSTAGIALAALLSAGWHSFASPEAMAPFRFLELIYLYQSIASSSFLSLNYPSVYRAFSLNFAWAVGLISSSTLQNSINRMRHLTGGHLADATGGSAVGLVNRKLSPYNSNSAIAIPFLSISPRELPPSFAKFSSPLNIGPVLSKVRAVVTGEVQTVTASSSNVLQAGVPIFVNTIHIATANAFMTVFIFVLCMFAIAMGIFLLGYGSIFAVDHVRRRRRHSSVSHFFSSLPLFFVKGWILRLSLLATFPLLIFIFYQWTLKDSWLSILLSVIVLLAIAALLAYPAFQILRLARRESSFSLYAHNDSYLYQHGPLYAQYRPSRYFFFLAPLIACVLRAIFIAFGQASGQAQLALMIVVEFSLVATHFVLKPFKTKGGDVFSTYLAITRLVCTALMIAFIEKVNVKAIPRVVIGIIIAIIFSVSIVVTVLNLALHAFGPLWGRKSGKLASVGSTDCSQRSMLEKGEGNRMTGDSEKSHEGSSGEIRGYPDHHFLTGEAGRARPLNPTPNQSTYDHNLYPISPTGTVTTMDPPSLYSRDSGTITVGSLLPRRWSFSFSQPSSPAGSSLGHQERQYRTSLTPSPLPPPSPSGSGAPSRNASLRAYPSHQMSRHQHDDIQEEPVATGSVSPS